MPLATHGSCISSHHMVIHMHYAIYPVCPSRICQHYARPARSVKLERMSVLTLLWRPPSLGNGVMQRRLDAYIR
jgi:hypothetical protein